MKTLTAIVTELEERGTHNGDKNNDNKTKDNCHLHPVSFFPFFLYREIVQLGSCSVSV